MSQDARVLSYLSVRRALGLLGLVLPATLVIYAWPLQNGMQPSISEFYHTHMGDFFVGCLLAIGVFLIAYLGYPREKGELLADQWVSTLAGIGAIGVALFPVVPPDQISCPPGETFSVVGAAMESVTCPIQGVVGHWQGFAWIHFASATLFFTCLAIFCFFLFPKSDRHPNGSINWSTARNRTYLVCGVAILLSIAGIGAFLLIDGPNRPIGTDFAFVFWAETLGVTAFAISWLVKGKIGQGVKELFQHRSAVT